MNTQYDDAEPLEASVMRQEDIYIPTIIVPASM